VKQIDDGGPAFPESNSLGVMQHGMSLRDYFAGQALPGVIAVCAKEPNVRGKQPEEVWATVSYLVADAMIRARLASHE
jgi:hypothetical protein